MVVLYFPSSARQYITIINFLVISDDATLYNCECVKGLNIHQSIRIKKTKQNKKKKQQDSLQQ